MKILVLNAGSSSQKSCLYELETVSYLSTPSQPLWHATVDWSHHQGVAEIKLETATGAVLKESLATTTRLEVMTHLLTSLWQGEMAVLKSLGDIAAVGHRVVHGGATYQQTVRVTPAVKSTIAGLASLAPAHNPANLEGMIAIEQVLGEAMPQFAVFDTAFHHSLPAAAAIYPGPYAWQARGIRRYGFHGISHQYCAQRVQQLWPGEQQGLRLIICHLGNGCSLSAVRDGICLDTTMGFTPLDGLMMGTRAGAVDPGILLHLLRQEGYTPDQLDQELNKASGLLGMSGVSADLRQVLAAIEAGNAQAQLALDIYIHRLRGGIGAMLASLGGLDALVFTAGVGENSTLVRAKACAAFGFLGLDLDPELNASHPVDQDIATPASKVRVYVIHTQEDWPIARECYVQMGGA
jgi:acetate kinase